MAMHAKWHNCRRMRSSALGLLTNSLRRMNTGNNKADKEV